MAKRIFTEEHRRKLSESHMGNKGFWVGKKFSEEHKTNLSKAKKGVHSSPSTEFKKGLIPWNKNMVGYGKGSKNGMWKGDSVGYHALHAWIRRNLGKPIKCEDCDSIKNIQWANKSHEYKRDKNDWRQLCVPCHRIYDKDTLGVKEIYIQRTNLLKI